MIDKFPRDLEYFQQRELNSAPSYPTSESTAVCKEGAHYWLLLRTFSAHAKVVAREAKEMRNTQDTRTAFVSRKSGRFQLCLVEKMRRFLTDEK